MHCITVEGNKFEHHRAWKEPLPRAHFDKIPGSFKLELQATLSQLTWTRRKKKKSRIWVKIDHAMIGRRRPIKMSGPHVAGRSLWYLTRTYPTKSCPRPFR